MVAVVPLEGRTSDYAREVGARIVSARKEKLLTQVELAEIVGVSQRSMQAYEVGETVPYRKIREIARVLERPVEYFLYGEAAFVAPEERLESMEKTIQRLAEAIESLSRKRK